MAGSDCGRAVHPVWPTRAHLLPARVDANARREGAHVARGPMLSYRSLAADAKAGAEGRLRDMGCNATNTPTPQNHGRVEELPMRALFLTWDSGDTNYLESLFFPVFRLLQERHAVEVHTLQLTWSSLAYVERLQAVAESHRLSYECARVPAKASKAAAISSLAGTMPRVLRTMERENIDVILPRALVPLALAVPASLLARKAIAWDADGLPADERVDFAGLSPRSPRYLMMRALELAGLRSASSIMVRTERAREILTARVGRGFDASKIFVVPNGRDEGAFAYDGAVRAALRQERGIPPHALVTISVGTLTAQYLPGEQAQLVAALQRRDPLCHACFLTAQREEIRRALREAGADLRRCHILRVPADEVPRYLMMADVGIALRERSFSQQAVSPIKVSEYLLSGLHVVCSRGIGDLDEVLAEAGGTLIETCNEEAIEAVAAELLVRHHAGELQRQRQEVRTVGVRHFSLEACAAGYMRLLERAFRR